VAHDGAKLQHSTCRTARFASALMMMVQTLPHLPAKHADGAQRRQFLDLLYAAALDPSLVWRASRALCELIGGERVFVYARDLRRLSSGHGRLIAEHGLDASLALERGLLANLTEEIDAATADGRDRVLSGVVLSPDAGHEARFLALLVTLGERVFGFVICLSRGHSEQQKSLAWEVLGDVRRAFDLHVRASDDSLANILGARLLFEGEIGFLVSCDMKFESANAVAADLLQRSSPIARHGQTLAFEHAKAHAAFERVSMSSNPAARAALVVPSKTGGETWLVQLTKLAQADPLLAHGERRVVIVITSFSAASRSRAAALESIAGLTSTERSILRALVDGIELSTLADQTGRSVKTLRWHLRNLFAKLRVNSQADLARIGALLLPI
jgi:DNA-binding CsgD family transcriptional regulator